MDGVVVTVKNQSVLPVSFFRVNGTNGTLLLKLSEVGELRDWVGDGFPPEGGLLSLIL